MRNTTKTFCVLWILLEGCTGTIAGVPRGGGTGAGGASGASTGAAGGGGAASGGGAGGSTTPRTAFTTSPGLRRLTPSEYENSVLDLLGVVVNGDETPHPLVVLGHGAIAGAQKTGYDDTNSYVDIAARVAASAAPPLDAKLTCRDDACLRDWATDFLLRAFRAPAPAALLDRYAGILTAADAGATRAERVETFLATILSSPYFLYRRELGTPPGGAAAARALDPYEVASRLSLLVWQSGPDAALFAAAASGSLLQPAQRVAQLQRMLQDQRARRGLRAFVRDWMGLQENNLSKKNAALLAGLGADFPQVASRALDLLIDDVLASAATPRLSDLLKTDQAFANDSLGAVLGVTGGGGAALQKVTVDPRQRLGLLTQPMVLGAHTKESGASPFPIGKFIYENVLCEEVPPPPAMFPPVEDTTSATQTLRQRLEGMTANEPCHTCHVRIGPPGYAFLPFDPVGRYMNADARGMPYDTAGTLPLPGGAGMLSFSSASDLAGKLAAEPVVQRCVARRFYRWTYGRFEAAADQQPLGALETSAVSTGAEVAALLRQTVEGADFAQVRIAP